MPIVSTAASSTDPPQMLQLHNPTADANLAMEVARQQPLSIVDTCADNRFLVPDWVPVVARTALGRAVDGSDVDSTMTGKK